MSTILAAAGEVLQPLHRSIDRIAGLAPGPAFRARAALGAALAPILASRWPEVVSSFSRLTNTGFPVELAWSSRDSAVRWTAEVAPPETAERERLGIAARLARFEAVPDEWLAAQRPDPLRFGAWLGMRHGPSGDATKVYLELPAGLPQHETSRHEIFRLPELTWSMAGLFPDGSREIYGRASNMNLDLLARIEQSAFGVFGRLTRAATTLVGDTQIPADGGVSVTLDRAHRAASLTWFTFAKLVFRDDRQARTSMGRACAELADRPAEGSIELYEALASGPEDGRWRHGIVGVGLTVDGTRWIQAGVRPS